MFNTNALFYTLFIFYSLHAMDSCFEYEKTPVSDQERQEICDALTTQWIDPLKNQISTTIRFDKNPNSTLFCLSTELQTKKFGKTPLKMVPHVQQALDHAQRPDFTIFKMNEETRKKLNKPIISRRKNAWVNLTLWNNLTSAEQQLLLYHHLSLPHSTKLIRKNINNIILSASIAGTVWGINYALKKSKYALIPLTIPTLNMIDMCNKFGIFKKLLQEPLYDDSGSLCLTPIESEIVKEKERLLGHSLKHQS